MICTDLWAQSWNIWIWGVSQGILVLFSKFFSPLEFLFPWFGGWGLQWGWSPSCVGKDSGPVLLHDDGGDDGNSEVFAYVWALQHPTLLHPLCSWYSLRPRTVISEGRRWYYLIAFPGRAVGCMQGSPGERWRMYAVLEMGKSFWLCSRKSLSFEWKLMKMNTTSCYVRLPCGIC